MEAPYSNDANRYLWLRTADLCDMRAIQDQVNSARIDRTCCASTVDQYPPRTMNMPCHFSGGGKELLASFSQSHILPYRRSRAAASGGIAIVTRMLIARLTEQTFSPGADSNEAGQQMCRLDQHQSMYGNERGASDVTGRNTFMQHTVLHVPCFDRTLKGPHGGSQVNTVSGAIDLDVDHAIHILAFESHSNYTTLHLRDNKRMVISRSMKQFEDLLQGTAFMRVHNSWLVNLKHIRKYLRGEGGEVVLSNSLHVPVARRKKQELMDTLEMV